MPSVARPALATLTALMLLALVPGCERTPPPVDPAAPTPVADTPVAAAAPVAPAPAAWVQTFSTDDARIGTEVGEHTLGLGLATTGKTGWLMFGPYIPLPAGNYQVALQGSVQEGHAGVVHVDVAQAKGVDVVAAVDLDAPALLAPSSPDGIAVLGFTLAKPSTNLEVRVRVTDASKLSISGYVIRAVP